MAYRELSPLLFSVVYPFCYGMDYLLLYAEKLMSRKGSTVVSQRGAPDTVLAAWDFQRWINLRLAYKYYRSWYQVLTDQLLSTRISWLSWATVCP